MNDIKKGVREGLIEESDIDEKLISSCLNTGESLPVDMLIRTSGEHRLSDFFLFQCSNSFVYFEDVLWPEFNFWHLMKAVYAFQRSKSKIVEIEKSLSQEENSELGSRPKKFLKWLKEERKKEKIKNICN